MEIGLYTLGDLTPDPTTGRRQHPRQRLQEIVAGATLAEQAGLDVFGVGEHHRSDFAVSATSVVLAAIAQATSRIHLVSANTILSTADPVRVFQEYATLDLLSDGRAEIIVGRGAFTESFPLFGYRVDDHSDMFAEKLELLVQINSSERTTWQGKFRSSLSDAEIAPRPLQASLPIWVGVAGTPQSAARAGALGLPMVLGVLSAPRRLQPLVEVHRRAGIDAGHDPRRLCTAVASQLSVHRDSQRAFEGFFPYYANYYRYSMPDSHRRKVERTEYERSAGLDGALFVGSPDQIIEKILYQYELFGHRRFLAQVDLGGQPYDRVASTIELLGNKVAPVVRRSISQDHEPLVHEARQ